MKTRTIATIGMIGTVLLVLAYYWAKLDIKTMKVDFMGSPQPRGFYYWACNIAGYTGLALIGVSAALIAALGVTHSVRKIQRNRA